jgi:hypothetical protein
MSEPLISGKNTTFRVYLNNTPKTLWVKTWAIKESVVEVTDQVNGELRARVDVITDFFDCNFECYDDSQTALLEALIACIANDDAFNPPVPNSAGILFQYQNGTSKKAFTLNGATRFPIDLKSGGRTERLMHTCHFRATTFTQAVST